jgi:hypothetical protein
MSQARQPAFPCYSAPFLSPTTAEPDARLKVYQRQIIMLWSSAWRIGVLLTIGLHGSPVVLQQIPF